MDDPNKQSDQQFSSLIDAADEAKTVTPAKKRRDRQEQDQVSPSPMRQALALLRRDWRTKFSVGVLGLFVLLALIGPSIYQHIGGPYTSAISGQVYGPAVYHSYDHEELDRQNELPSSQYWLGTDEIGRDILARLLQGMLVSLILAVSVEVVDVVLGIIVGILAGYYGGWIDQLLARFTDLIFAFPTTLFLILVAGIYGSFADSAFGKIPVIGPAGGGRLIIIFLALSLFVWPTMARLVRGQTLQIKEQQFIEAARTAGTTDFRIMRRHIVPNLISVLIVAASLDMAGTIGAEAGISLLGLGIQPPGSSLGLMIASAAPFTAVYPWEVMVPSVVLTLIVLAFSFLGDALRDAFDPR
jgi:oligopeptide transport system permease protein